MSAEFGGNLESRRDRQAIIKVPKNDMATGDDANDERLMRRAIAESRLAVEEDNAMVRNVCMCDSLVLYACLFVT